MSREFEDKVLMYFKNIDKKFESIDKKFENIDKRFDRVENILEVHTTILDKHTRILDEHTKKLNEHTAQINSLNESVILIENKVMSEFPALFEAFSMHQEFHEDLNEKISYLRGKTQENSMRISVLEDQMKFVKNN